MQEAVLLPDKCKASLEKITLEGMNELDRDFQRDPATFADMSLFSAYRYSPEETRKRFERYGAPDRRHFLIRLDGRPVGETGIKHIDWEKREGELSIHLQNDAVKNRGIGTAADTGVIQLTQAAQSTAAGEIAPPHRKIMEWQTLHRYAGKHCLLALRHVNDHAFSLLPRRYAKKMPRAVR